MTEVWPSILWETSESRWDDDDDDDCVHCSPVGPAVKTEVTSHAGGGGKDNDSQRERIPSSSTSSPISQQSGSIAWLVSRRFKIRGCRGRYYYMLNRRDSLCLWFLLSLLISSVFYCAGQGCFGLNFYVCCSYHHPLYNYQRCTLIDISIDSTCN